MNGENWLLFIDELVAFEKQPVKVQDFRKITDHFQESREISSNS